MIRLDKIPEALGKSKKSMPSSHIVSSCIASNGTGSMSLAAT